MKIKLFAALGLITFSSVELIALNRRAAGGQRTTVSRGRIAQPRRAGFQHASRRPGNPSAKACECRTSSGITAAHTKI